jgi:predicted ATP-grasp superfamily ATP-dependent carboligase
MSDLLNFSAKPKMKKPTLVIGWERDTGVIGARVTEYLLQNLQMQPFCDIDPVEFFPLGGVGIENDIVQFPQSTFYASAEHNLIIFRSAMPRYEWHKFLNLVIDVAQDYCKVKEMYAVGGMVAMSAHTLPREAWATFSSPQMKKSLSPYQLSKEMDFETPPGSRPTLNSYLLWMAKTRNVPAANLWVPVPFYLMGSEDPASNRKALEFLNKRVDLQLDFGPLDKTIKKQNDKLANLRASSEEINNCFAKLESNQQLADEEHENLVKAVDSCLKIRSI